MRGTHGILIALFVQIFFLNNLLCVSSQQDTKELEKHFSDLLKKSKDDIDKLGSQSDLLKNLQDHANSVGSKVPKDLAEQLSNILTKGMEDPESIDLSQINHEEIETVITNTLTEKCVNVSRSQLEGEKNAADVKLHAQNTMECITPLTDFSELETEIEVLKKNGSLEIAFNKYCGRRQAVKDCVSNFTAEAGVCLEESEKEKLAGMTKLVYTMLEFICFKEGDHIALFISEGGPDCFKKHEAGIKECIETAAAKYIGPGKPAPGIESMKNASCSDVDTIKACVVSKLEQCENSTPGNLAESMFKVLKNECMGENSYLQGSPTRGHSSITKSPLTLAAMIIGTLSMLVFTKFVI